MLVYLLFYHIFKVYVWDLSPIFKNNLYRTIKKRATITQAPFLSLNFSLFLRATKSLSEMRITARTIKIIPTTSMAKKWSPIIKTVKMTEATGSTEAKRLPLRLQPWSSP